MKSKLGREFEQSRYMSLNELVSKALISTLVTEEISNYRNNSSNLKENNKKL